MKNNIKQARLSCGFTQSDLAQMIDTTQNQIYKLESGSVDLKASTLVKLSGVLGVSVSYLIGLEDNTRTLASEEAELLEYFQCLDGMDKLAILQLVKSLSKH